jgi:hypothetical protein
MSSGTWPVTLTAARGDDGRLNLSSEASRRLVEECEGLPPSPVNKKPCGCAGKADARAGAPITPPSCLECVEKHLGLESDGCR